MPRAKKKVKKKATKKKIGRPTKYKAEYCEMIVKHMAMGLSMESFAAKIGTHRQRLYDWRDKNKEFEDSIKKGLDASLLFWEGVGMNGTIGMIKNFNCGSWIFTMKNRFGWRDTKDFDIGVQPITVHFERYKEKE